MMNMIKGFFGFLVGIYKFFIRNDLGFFASFTYYFRIMVCV